MPNRDQFKQLYQLADQLIIEADKNTLAEAARLLAINLAHYQLTYGELPLDEVLACLTAENPNDQQLEMLSVGMENLAGTIQILRTEGQEDPIH